MRHALLRHHVPATNGAPQTVAVGFFAMIFLTLWLPFVEYSSGGATTPDILVHVMRSEAGFNLFAVILLLAPPVGIAVAMTARSAWRVGTLLVALIALVMIPLTLFTLNRGIVTATAGVQRAWPGVGSYVLMIGYLILVLATGVTAFRARHSE